MLWGLFSVQLSVRGVLFLPKAMQNFLPLWQAASKSVSRDPHLLVFVPLNEASPWVWAGFGDLLQANGMLQRWGLSYLRFGYKKDCISGALSGSFALSFRAKPAAMLWAAQWKGPCDIWLTDLRPAGSHYSINLNVTVALAETWTVILSETWSRGIPLGHAWISDPRNQ